MTKVGLVQHCLIDVITLNKHSIYDVDSLSLGWKFVTRIHDDYKYVNYHKCVCVS
jgi:hypothetical protein